MLQQQCRPLGHTSSHLRGQPREQTDLPRDTPPKPSTNERGHTTMQRTCDMLLVDNMRGLTPSSRLLRLQPCQRRKTMLMVTPEGGSPTIQTPAVRRTMCMG